MFKIICFLLLLISCKEDNSKDNIIVVGMSMDFPPFEYIKDGNPVGFEVDLINEIGKIIGKEIKLTDIDFPGIIGSLNANKIDIGISGFSITLDRQKVVDFADCYYYPKIAALINIKTDIKDESDLYNKKIGVQSGTTMEIYLQNLKKQHPALIIHSLSRNTYLVQELKLGRIDAVMLEDAQAVEFTKNNEHIFKYKMISEDKNSCYSMVFNKNSPLKQQVNDALHLLQQNGKLKAIEDRWL